MGESGMHAVVGDEIEPTMDRDMDPALEPGVRVEVRRRFDRSWARGFEVAEVVEAGYRIRRRSDGAVLPADFEAEEVRPERKRQGLWWY